ncbi:MAG: transcriptional regulator [Chloroflexota bacterium]
MKNISTRVFDLAEQHGYKTASALAKAMRVSESLISRIRSGERHINSTFITGARYAFPDKSLDELFTVELEPEIEQVA